MKKHGTVLFIIKYFKEIVFSLLYLAVSTLLLRLYQRNILCLEINHCQYFASSYIFLIMNLTLGWVMCFYVIAFVRRIKLSGLLKILFPLVAAIYFLGIYYSFGNYVMVNGDIFIQRANSFESADSHNINEFVDIYKSGSSGDGFDYYSIKLKNGNSVSISDDSVIDFLFDRYGLY